MVDIPQKYFDFCDIVYENWKLSSQTYYNTYIKPFIICHGLCIQLKCKKTTRPIYDNHRRCTKCEVYFTKDIKICPCCKIITRSKPHSSVNRERYNNKTIRIDNHETRHLHSSMLST